MRCTSEMWRVLLHICLMRFHAFWCTTSVRDILLRCHAFWGRYELCVSDFMLFGCYEMSWWDFMLFGRRFCFWCREICTRWLIGLCVVLCVKVGWFVSGGWKIILWWWFGESASALGDRRVCVEVVWFACQKHAIVIVYLGGWVGREVYVIWRTFTFFGLSQYFDQGSSAFFSFALTWM